MDASIESRSDKQALDEHWVATDPEGLDGELEFNRWPRSVGIWLVAIYIGLFIIRPWEVIAPWLADIRFERLYAIFMIAIVVLSGRRWTLTRQCISVVMFAGAVALSAVFAWQSQLSWTPLYRYATVVVTYFLIVSVIRCPHDLYFLVVTYIGTMWLYVSKSLWEYFVHGRHEFAQSVPRLLGIDLTYGEPNAFAMSVTVSLPLWLFLWRRRLSMTAGWSRIWKSGFLLVIGTYPLLSFVAVLMTNSRAGMLGIAAFVMISQIYSGRSYSWVKSTCVGLILMLVLWGISPQQQKERLRTLWDPSAGPSNAHASADGRWEGFVAAIQMCERYPITGVGIGNFLDYRVSYLDGVPKVAHNLAGQILGEFGVVGGLAFSFMLYALWRSYRSTIRICQYSSTHRNYYELAFAIRNSILLLLLFGLSLHNALRFNWLWMAAFASCLHAFTDEESHHIFDEIIDEAT